MTTKNIKITAVLDVVSRKTSEVLFEDITFVHDYAPIVDLGELTEDRQYLLTTAKLAFIDLVRTSINNGEPKYASLKSVDWFVMGKIIDAEPNDKKSLAA